VTTPLVLLGGGGHCVTVLHVLQRLNAVTPTFDVLGVLDDASPDQLPVTALGIAHLGPLSALAGLGDVAVAVTVGTSAGRRAVSAFAEGHLAARAIDPTAVIARSVQLGEGTLAAYVCAIGPGATVGRHTVVGNRSAIGRGATLGAFTSVLSAVVIGERAVLGEGVTVGSSAVIAPGVRIGPWATVGAGSVVVDDVAPGATVIGNPARPLPA